MASSLRSAITTVTAWIPSTTPGMSQSMWTAGDRLSCSNMVMGSVKLFSGWVSALHPSNRPAYGTRLGRSCRTSPTLDSLGEGSQLLHSVAERDELVPSKLHRDRLQCQTASKFSTLIYSRENDVVIQHGPIHLQIAALLRSALPLVPDAARAVRDAIHPHQRRSVSAVRHTQTRVPTRSERMIPPLGPTAPATSKP